MTCFMEHIYTNTGPLKLIWQKQEEGTLRNGIYIFMSSVTSSLFIINLERIPALSTVLLLFAGPRGYILTAVCLHFAAHIVCLLDTGEIRFLIKFCLHTQLAYHGNSFMTKTFM